VPLVIVGDGPLRSQLAEQAAAEGKSNIHFVGQQPPAQVSDYLRRACFAVLPSITYETFGRVLVEAYAHGVPVLATRLGATPEIVQDGRTGLLFDPHDAADLAAKLDRLARHPDQSQGMRQPARAAYERLYSASHNADLLLAAYTQALDLHNGRRPST
jgi:glycosyltransferase involved in cell wall biosynthesis